MNPSVLALIASLNCADARIPFADFYKLFFHVPAIGEHWAGARYEQTTIVMMRVVDAEANYLEYAVARMEKCGGATKEPSR